MNATDLFALLPLLLLAGTSVVVMVAIAVRRSHRLTLGLTLMGLAASFISLWVVAPLTPRQVTPLLILDRYALFYIGLTIAATFAVALLSFGYLEIQAVDREEFYVLLLVAALGSSVLVTSSHFASFFLGLEILSVSLYSLNAYLRTRARPLEAGIKYLILAASSAAFLLFGMALIYSQTGTMEFSSIRTLLTSGANFDRAVLLMGTALMITGFGFKLALVPFHLWTPDIYEGAPAPVAAFVATVSKGAMFALLLRYFYHSGTYSLGAIPLVFSIIAIASMVVGNLLALLQDNIKRLLAYSSIAHMGYLLVAFEAGGGRAAGAVAFYLTAYFITMLGAFGVVTVMSTRETGSRSSAGLSRPVLAPSRAGTHIHRDASFPCRNPSHSGVRREVLCSHQWGFIRVVVAGHYPRCDQCFWALLLSTGCGDVICRDGGKRRRLRTTGTFASAGGGLRSGRPFNSADRFRGVPRASFERYSESRRKPCVGIGIDSGRKLARIYRGERFIGYPSTAPPVGLHPGVEERFSGTILFGSFEYLLGPCTDAEFPFATLALASSRGAENRNRG